MFSLAVLLGVLLPGVCVESTQAAENVLRFGFHVSDIGRLDPHRAAGSQDRAVADMVFNGLLRYTPGNAPKIEADLAESIPKPEISGGKQIWTFKLRKGVMFHAGPATPTYELTAEDVVFSFQKAADPKFSAYAGGYHDITFEKVDDYTVRMSLAQPLSATLLLPKLCDYGGGFIVSKKAIETMGYEAFKAHPVGTGPFMFANYTPGKRLRLKANKAYFRGRPFLEGVEIHFFPDFKDRADGLRRGECDVIVGPGRSSERTLIDKFTKERDLVSEVFGVGEVGVIHFNTTVQPLNDIRVRRAISYALNRTAFFGVVSKRLVAPVYSPVPAQFLPGGLKKDEVVSYSLGYDTNIEKARQLLAEAGYANGFSFEVVTSEKRIYRMSYEVLREQLATIGIDCKIKVVPHGKMHKMIRQGVNPMVIYYAWRPNADVYLTQFFHSDSIVRTGVKPVTNFSHYDKIDKLIEAARLEIHPQHQINLWQQAQIRILHDAVAYPLFSVRQCYTRSSNVDYGHKLISAMALYPQIIEKTRFINAP